MKKQLLLLSTALTVVFASCSKEEKLEEPKLKTQTNILTAGKWQGKSSTSEYYLNDIYMGKEVESIADQTIHFQSGGKLITYENGVAVETMSYRLLSDNQIKLEYTTDEGDESLIAEITELNDTHLKIAYVSEEMEDGMAGKLKMTQEFIR